MSELNELEQAQQAARAAWKNWEAVCRMAWTGRNARKWKRKSAAQEKREWVALCEAQKAQQKVEALQQEVTA